MRTIITLKLDILQLLNNKISLNYWILRIAEMLNGRGARNRTMIYGFGDRYTNRCTTPLTKILMIFVHFITLCAKMVVDENTNARMGASTSQ